VSFLQASSRTSLRYVPGVTLTFALRKELSSTTTWEAMSSMSCGKVWKWLVSFWKVKMPSVVTQDTSKKPAQSYGKSVPIANLLSVSRIFVTQRGGVLKLKWDTDILLAPHEFAQAK
jgi:hypothetical protein